MTQESEHGNTVTSGNVTSQYPTSGISVAKGFSVVGEVVTSTISVACVVHASEKARKRLPAIIKAETFQQGAGCDFKSDIVNTIISVAQTKPVTTIQVDRKAKPGLRDGTVTQPYRQPRRLLQDFPVSKPQNRKQTALHTKFFRCCGT